MDAVTKAIEKAGGPAKLAAAVGVRINVVTNWRKRGKVARDFVLAVEQASGVSRHELRPETFGPNPTNAEAA